MLLKCLKKNSANTYHLKFLKLSTHAFDTFVVFESMDFKGEKIWKRPLYSTPWLYIKKKGGLSNCQWLLDKKCQPVWLFNCPETVINFVIILLLKEIENIMTPCSRCQHWKGGVTFTYKNLKLYRFKSRNQFEIKKEYI